MSTCTRRAIVYVDGLNLYHSAYRGTTHKWADIRSPAEDLVPAGVECKSVKYFTADLAPQASDDPDRSRKTPQ